MPRPTPKSSRNQPPIPETVNPLWLVKAIGITIVAALFCGYLTFCYLFYLSQWQIVLHPKHASSNTPSLPGQIIHFGLDESATPRLTGWWMPAPVDGRYADSTILFLPGGDGSLEDFTPTLTRLHALGINVFAFDYRGYGRSASSPHPSEENMSHDADSAWQYLTTSRSIAGQHIIPYGTGVGASLAAALAASHPDIPALILESPHTDLLDVALNDPRMHLLPVRMLFHEHFALATPLSTLHTPKLLLTHSSAPDKAFHTAAEPKVTVELPSVSSDTLNDQAIARFLDQYVSRNAPALVPSTAPASTNSH